MGKTKVTSYWKYEKWWHRLLRIKTVYHDVYPNFVWQHRPLIGGKWKATPKSRED